MASCACRCEEKGCAVCCYCGRDFTTNARLAVLEAVRVAGEALMAEERCREEWKVLRVDEDLYDALARALDAAKEKP